MAPHLAHCSTRLRIIRSQPSKPPTNDATMTKKEKPPAITVGAPAPTFFADADSCASWTVARCWYVSGTSSASETGLPVTTSVIMGSGTCCDTKRARISRSPDLDVCELAVPVATSMSRPNRMPRTDGIRRMKPMTTTGPLIPNVLRGMSAP